MDPEEVLSSVVAEALADGARLLLGHHAGGGVERRPTVPFTPRQLAALDFIDDFRRRYRISPTIEEIAKALEVSKITVHEFLNQLERKGTIRREKYRSRSIEVLVPPPERSAGCRYCGGVGKP